MADKNDHAEKLAADARAASKSREEHLRESRKAADEATKAHYERVNSTQPTPTQEENDRAKLGFNSLEELDEKEDDGSPKEKAAVSYTTRDAAPKK